MTTFDEREQAFEKKFAHQENLDFAVGAKTSKIFGLWAAEQLGISGDEAQAYAQSVVSANLEEAGFEDVIRKVRKDFDEKGLTISDHLMRVELDRALAEARKQVSSS
ncbi:MAG: DUF1476 domain-containing protein [Alphaproteobacteria bacterium]|nr:DUF1476 domain-containing protein [Alphaproteobacteria bacterium]